MRTLAGWMIPVVCCVLVASVLDYIGEPNISAPVAGGLSMLTLILLVRYRDES